MSYNIITGTTGDDNLIGTNQQDSITAKKGNDFLDGGSGDDSLRGGSGNDTLVGGLGRDTIKGGGGADLIEFDIPPGNAGGFDIVGGFQQGLDKIQVEDIIGGTLNANEFAIVSSNAAAKTSNAPIVFNSSNNRLFYNPNGSNGGFGSGGGSIARFNVDIEYSDFVGDGSTGPFNYGEALQKSFLFYEAQRSGDLPSDNRIPWRGDSALTDGDLNQDGDFNDVVNGVAEIDLTGGYYDAGDHVKFGLPMASSMTLLSWGAIEYQDAYQQSGQLDEVLDAIKWGTDYILKAHVSQNGETQAFYGQVGDGNIDHSYWGAPEDMTMERPIFKLDDQNHGADLAGESAAALASASIAWRSENSQYADDLLDNARQLYDFAKDNPGKYSDSITQASPFYTSQGYTDELVWAATWLYKATGETSYLNDATNDFQYLGYWTHAWENKSYGSAVLLAEATTGSQSVQYRTQVEQWLDYWSDDTGSGIQYTDGGLAWLHGWGSVRYAANTAFIASVYSDYLTEYNLDATRAQQYDQFAQQQIDYILGDNPNNFSYMIGFGENYPLEPHHRGSSGTTDINQSGPNQYILYGGLVGGPASANDNDYVDERTDYQRNEVALDYNAGLTGALAWMYDQYGGEPLTDTQIENLPFEQI